MVDTLLDSAESANQQQAVVDVAKLKVYVSKVVRTFFDEETFTGVDGSLGECLEDRRNDEVLQKYISDAQLRALLVRGVPSKGESFL